MIHHHTVGDARITGVIEYSGPTHDPAFLYPAVDKAERDAVLKANASWLAPNHYVPHMDRLIVTIQLWVVHAGGNVIVIDTGVGNRKPRPAERMDRLNTLVMPWLEAAGAGPSQVTHVVMTHMHTDHVGWNTVEKDGNWVPTFPKARYLFSKKELDYWLAENDKAALPPIVDSVIPIVEAKRCDLITSDHAVDDTVVLLPTPGHTIDHYAVALGRGGKDAVITGDLIHSPLQAKYTELAMRVDYDSQQGADTRRKFLETYCDTNTLCCFAHFPTPSRGYLKRWGNGFRCEYVTD